MVHSAMGSGLQLNRNPQYTVISVQIPIKCLMMGMCDLMVNYYNCLQRSAVCFAITYVQDYTVCACVCLCLQTYSQPELPTAERVDEEVI